MAEGVTAVIGGNGFIGRRLVELLLEDGCQVRVISRRGVSPDPRAGAQAADVSDAAAMRRALEGCDCVYSLSTGGGDSWSDFERDIIGGARNVAAACLGHGARRLIYVSSIAALYLGGAKVVSDGEPADRQSAKRSYYARAKALAEAELLKLRSQHGLRLTIVRPGVVMGPGGQVTHSGLGMWTTDVDCIGWGAGGHPLPFVLASEVAEALRAARTAPDIDGLALNLACGVQVTARQFVEEYARRSMRLIRFHSRPLWQLWAVDVFKWLVKIAARKAENPFPHYRDYASRSLRSRLSCEVAREKLNWRPSGSAEAFFAATIDANLPRAASGDLRLSA